MPRLHSTHCWHQPYRTSFLPPPSLLALPLSRLSLPLFLLPPPPPPCAPSPLRPSSSLSRPSSRRSFVCRWSLLGLSLSVLLFFALWSSLPRYSVGAVTRAARIVFSSVILLSQGGPSLFSRHAALPCTNSVELTEHYRASFKKAASHLSRPRAKTCSECYNKGTQHWAQNCKKRSQNGNSFGSNLGCFLAAL